MRKVFQVLIKVIISSILILNLSAIWPIYFWMFIATCASLVWQVCFVSSLWYCHAWNFKWTSWHECWIDRQVAFGIIVLACHCYAKYCWSIWMDFYQVFYTGHTNKPVQHMFCIYLFMHVFYIDTLSVRIILMI